MICANFLKTILFLIDKIYLFVRIGGGCDKRRLLGAVSDWERKKRQLRQLFFIQQFRQLNQTTCAAINSLPRHGKTNIKQHQERTDE